MVKWLLLLITFTHAAVAGEGRVMVLEAPLFRRPSIKSKIVQYVQKNEVIYVHPQVLVDERKYRQFRPDEAKRRELEEQLARDPDLKDPFFEDFTPYNYRSKFVLTKDNQGRDAWILRRHVHVFYEDEREFTQLEPRPDPTDYRLREPLPDGYPLYDHDRQRGWIQFSVGSAFNKNYPYRERVTTESYGQQLELNAALLWVRPKDRRERTFLGGFFTVRTSQSDYTVIGRRTEETWTRFGIGPLLSYDPYRREKNMVTLYVAPILYPYAQASITQKDTTGLEDTRTYWAWGASARVGAQYQRLKLISILDLVVGVWAEAEGPLSMESRNAARVPAWWREGRNDRFSTGFTYTLAGQVGIQASY